MCAEPVDLEELLLALLAADNLRRHAALRVLRGERLTAGVEDDDGPALMRTGEAAQFLGISRTTLWRLVRDGRIDQIEIRRGSHRYRKADLKRFVRGDHG